MNRTTFLVDGFNLYHSVKEAGKDLGVPTKWLDLHSLLSFYLPVIGKDAQLADIYYFSAFAKHIDTKKPGTTGRHRIYIDALRASCIKVEMGRFKYKAVWCDHCKKETDHYEEKETDVAISIKLVELFYSNGCDTAVIVTGDTDLAPAVRTASQLFPDKNVCFAFPYKRKNNELAKLVNISFRIKKERYAQHQFPDPIVLPSGRELRKPIKW